METFIILIVLSTKIWFQGSSWQYVSNGLGDGFDKHLLLGYCG